MSEQFFAQYYCISPILSLAIASSRSYWRRCRTCVHFELHDIVPYGDLGCVEKGTCQVLVIAFAESINNDEPRKIFNQSVLSSPSLSYFCEMSCCRSVCVCACMHLCGVWFFCWLIGWFDFTEALQELKHSTHAAVGLASGFVSWGSEQ